MRFSGFWGRLPKHSCAGSRVSHEPCCPTGRRGEKCAYSTYAIRDDELGERFQKSERFFGGSERGHPTARNPTFWPRVNHAGLNDVPSRNRYLFGGASSG